MATALPDRRPKVDQQHQQQFDPANQLVQSKSQADLAENAKQLHHWQQDDALKFIREWMGHTMDEDAHSMFISNLRQPGSKLTRFKSAPHQYLNNAESFDHEQIYLAGSFQNRR